MCDYILQECKANGISVPNLGKLLCFVMSIPGSNAHTERVFSSLKNHKWTASRNKISVELIKSQLQVVVNFNYSCKELFNFLKCNSDFVNACKSSSKY